MLRNGKRVWALPFRRWLVEQAQRPGASVAGLALRHGLNANLLRHWMAVDASVRASAPMFLPVAVEPPMSVAAVATIAKAARPVPVIELELHGARIGVPQGVDAESLRVVIQVLRDTAA